MVSHEILTVCKPFFKKNKDSLVKALECVFYTYVYIFLFIYENIKPKDQASTHQKREEQTTGKHPAPTFQITLLGQGRSAGIPP